MATQHTIESLTDPRFNDVVLWEEFVGAGTPHSRDVITVTLSGTQTLKQGSVLFRAKGKDSTAVWDVVNGDADVDAANEYAVLIGSDLKTTETVDFTAATPKKVIALVRRAHLKNKTISDIVVTGFGVSASEYANLKRLMALQELMVSDTLTAITA